MEDNQHCIYNIIHFVEKNYDRLITVKELEEVANYSYRNIQRIFKYSCGETIGAFQQRLKVENAYKLILYTQETLTNIGFKVGFANMASFSKAFKKHFGIAPKAARLGKAVLLDQPSLVLQSANELLKPEIIYLKPIQVYYWSARTDYNNEEIELLWEKLMQNEFPEVDTEYYGVIVDEPLIKPQLKCRYDACATLPAKNKKLPVKTILGGKYARFIHKGSYQTIAETYIKIYSRWIFNTDLEFSHSPIIEKYEQHATDPTVEEAQLTYILLPLQ